jgi:hypothetical protein
VRLHCLHLLTHTQPELSSSLPALLPPPPLGQRQRFAASALAESVAAVAAVGTLNYKSTG